MLGGRRAGGGGLYTLGGDKSRCGAVARRGRSDWSVIIKSFYYTVSYHHSPLVSVTTSFFFSLLMRDKRNEFFWVAFLVYVHLGWFTTYYCWLGFFCVCVCVSLSLRVPTAPSDVRAYREKTPW